MKKYKPVIVLTLICIVVAGLLGGVHMLTEGVISGANEAVIKESLKSVMPEGDFDSKPDTLTGEVPETVKAVYTDKKGGGCVVILETNKGYTGKNIGLSVAISNTGSILKMQITKNEESIVPQNMKPMGDYGSLYSGVTAESLMELETGATVKYTEGAIKNAINDAFVYLGYSKAPTLPGLDENAVRKLILSDYLKDASLKDITPADADTHLRKLYFDETSGNYVAYVATIAAYGGGLETDGIIIVDGSGKIITADMLTWKVGHDLKLPDGYTDEYIGKTADSIESVELVSGATTTAQNFKNAVSDVLFAVSEATPESTGFSPEKLLGVCVLLLTATLITTAVLYEKGIFTRGGRKNEK